MSRNLEPLAISYSDRSAWLFTGLRARGSRDCKMDPAPVWSPEFSSKEVGKNYVGETQCSFQGHRFVKLPQRDAACHCYFQRNSSGYIPFWNQIQDKGGSLLLFTMFYFEFLHLIVTHATLPSKSTQVLFPSCSQARSVGSERLLHNASKSHSGPASVARRFQWNGNPSLSSEEAASEANRSISTISSKSPILDSFRNHCGDLSYWASYIGIDSKLMFAACLQASSGFVDSLS